MIKGKKIWLALLAVFVMVSFSFIAACSDPKPPELKAEFTNAFERKLYKGAVIDIEDYIVPVEGAAYTVTLAYTNSENQREGIEIEGKTVALNEAGLYTMVYSLTKDGVEASAEKSFEVYDLVPVVAVSAITQVYSLGQTRTLEVILNRLAPSIISESDYQARIVSVDVQNSLPVALIATENTNPVDTINLREENSFTFNRVATYRFSFEVTNTGGTVSASFNAIVLDDINVEQVAGVEAVKNASFAKSGENFDGSVVKLLGSADMTNASYVVYEDDYSLGQMARLEFYGKNVPYIGLLTKNNASGGNKNYGLYSGEGHIFSLERSPLTYSLFGTHKFSDKSLRLKLGNASREIEYFGWDNLEADKHYGLEVTIKADTPVAGSNNTYFSKGYIYWYLYEINNVGDYTLVAQCQEGAEVFNTAAQIADGRSNGIPARGQLVFYSSISKDVTFKFHKDTLFGSTVSDTDIEFDSSTKKLSWEPISGAHRYNVFVEGNKIANTSLQEIDFDPQDYMTSGSDFNTLAVKVVPTIGYNSLASNYYSYYIVSPPEGYVEGNSGVAASKGAMIAEKEGTGGIDGSIVKLVTHGGGGNSPNLANSSYVAYTEPYSIGEVVRVEFKGKNVPVIGLLTDNEDGYGITQGAGCLLTLERNATNTMLYGTQKFKTVNQIKRMGDADPYKIGWDNLDDNKRYGLEVTITGNTWDSVNNWYTSIKMHWFIYEINETTGEYKLVSTFTGDANLASGENSIISQGYPGVPEQGQLVFYGSGNKDITFTVFKDGLFGGQDLDDADITYDKATKVVSWEAVDGAARYNIFVDDELLVQSYDGTEIDLDDYVENYSGAVIKVVPTIGYNSLHDKFYTKATSDYKTNRSVSFDESTRTAVLQGQGAVKDPNGYNGTNNRYGAEKAQLARLDVAYVATAATYGLGTAVDIYFTGKNMPNVAFFASHINGNITSNGTEKGIILINGVRDVDGKAVMTNGTGTTQISNRIGVFGPNKISGTDCVGTSGQKRLLMDDTSVLADNRLVDGKEYKCTIAYVNNGGYVQVIIKIYEKNSGDWAVTPIYDKSSTGTDIPVADIPAAGHVIFYAGIKPDNTAFSFSEPYAYPVA